MNCASLNNPAITQFFTKGLGQGLRVFLLKPVTGKTHQIRVAMKSLGSPILGDTLYKGQSADRTYLHAFSLAFHYENNAIQIECPVTSGEHFVAQNFNEALSLLLPASQQSWPKLNKGLLEKINKQPGGETDLV